MRTSRDTWMKRGRITVQGCVRDVAGIGMVFASPDDGPAHD